METKWKLKNIVLGAEYKYTAMTIFVILVELWSLAMIETLVMWSLFAFLTAGAIAMLWIVLREILGELLW